MQNLINFLFFFSIALIPLGLIIRYNDNSHGPSIAALGFLGVFIYFLSKLDKNIALSHFKKWHLLFIIISLFMSLVLFAKYFYWGFGDYIGLLTVPLFFIISIFYIIKTVPKNSKIISTIILYTLLTIPLFGFDFYPKPIQFIPKDWYDRYNSNKTISTSLPYSFKSDEARELSIKAFDLRKSQNFSDAISLYLKAIEIEQDNPRLYFDISFCYAKSNQLELASAALGSAIKLDSLNSNFYNNRGLILSALEQDLNAINDYKKAIEIDTTQWVFYSNLALSYDDIQDFEAACKAIAKAEELGFDINKNRTLRGIKRKKCK